jgi:hypothetical protein
MSGKQKRQTTVARLEQADGHEHVAGLEWVQCLMDTFQQLGAIAARQHERANAVLNIAIKTPGDTPCPETSAT